jgi:hypothetical protein
MLTNNKKTYQVVYFHFDPSYLAHHDFQEIDEYDASFAQQQM